MITESPRVSKNEDSPIRVRRFLRKKRMVVFKEFIIVKIIIPYLCCDKLIIIYSKFEFYNYFQEK